MENDGAITGVRRDHLERMVMDTVFGQMVHRMILPVYEGAGGLLADKPSRTNVPSFSKIRRSPIWPDVTSVEQTRLAIHSAAGPLDGMVGAL